MSMSENVVGNRAKVLFTFPLTRLSLCVRCCWRSWTALYPASWTPPPSPRRSWTWSPPTRGPTLAFARAPAGGWPATPTGSPPPPRGVTLTAAPSAHISTALWSSVCRETPQRGEPLTYHRSLCSPNIVHIFRGKENYITKPAPQPPGCDSVINVVDFGWSPTFTTPRNHHLFSESLTVYVY